jgi:flagellar hook-length control protein FliK
MSIWRICALSRFASDTPAINSSAFSNAAQSNARSSSRQGGPDGIFTSILDVHAPQEDARPKPKPPAPPARSTDERPAPSRSEAPASSRDKNPPADKNGPSASAANPDHQETAPAESKKADPKKVESKKADSQQTDGQPTDQPAQDAAQTTDGIPVAAAPTAQDAVPQPVVVPAVPVVPVAAVVSDVAAPAQAVAAVTAATPAAGSATVAPNGQTDGAASAAADPAQAASATQAALASEAATPAVEAGAAQPTPGKKNKPLDAKNAITTAVAAGTSAQAGDEPADATPAKAGDVDAQPVLPAVGAAKPEKATAETGAPKAQATLPGAPDPTLQGAQGQPQPTFVAHLGQTAAQTAAAAPTPSSVTVPVADVAVTIAAQVQAGNSHFEIRLDPPELGRIEVRLHVQHDGQTTSHLIVERPDTLDLLRRDAPALERALEQAGLKTSENSLQFSLRDQAFSQQDRQQAQQQFTNRPFAQDDAAPAAIAAISRQSLLASLRGGLDIQV